MRRIKISLMLFVGVLIAVLSAGAQQQTGKAITNQNVISMAKNALPDSVIISAIKTNDTDFDISSSGLIALKKAGVSSKVMEAMLDVVNSKKSAPAVTPISPSAPGVSNASGFVATGASAPGTPNGAPSAPPGAAPGPQPTVLMVQSPSSLNVAPEATQIAQTKSKATSLSALALDQALGESLRIGQDAAQQALLKKGLPAMSNLGFGPGSTVLTGLMARRKQQSKITYVWALPGHGSPAQASSSTPKFDINYAGIPGVNVDAFEPVIVKVSPSSQSDCRLVGATEASTTAEQSTQQDWPIYSSFVEDRVTATVQKVSPGHAVLTPSAGLPAGQYAIALRPTDKSHKFSGEDVGKNQGEGLLFNYAWPFSVK